MIHLEVVGSSASPRANLLNRLGLLDREDSGTVGYPPPSHPTPHDASIIHIPTCRIKKGSRRAAQKITTHQQQNVPLPEPADQDLPADYVTTVNRAIASYNSIPTGSGRSTPVNAEIQSTLAVSQGGWTTGNTTERSSVDSSCYSPDEFDRKAANTVIQHFAEFESMLYEGPREAGSRVHRDQCQEWVTQFPHLRVLGKQLMAPSDVGYHFFTTESCSSTEMRPSTTGTLDLTLTESDLSISSDVQGLNVSGSKVQAMRAPPEISSMAASQNQPQDSNHSSSDLHFLYEEIFAQEGIYEDIIAVDYKNIYEDNMEHKKQITSQRRRVGYPPITPNACVKDCMSGGAFDKMWSEIMSWLRPLFRRYGLELEAKKSPGSLEHVLVPQRPVRASSFLLTPRNLQSADNPDFQLGMLPLLHVSKMALRDRNSQSMSSSEMSEPAMLGESTHAAFVPAPQMASSRPSTMHHPRRRPSHSQHLDPLREPSKVFNAEENRNPQPSPQNALRVKQIVPSSSHRLSSPPIPVPGRLPPLETSAGVLTHRKFGHRASSAIDNKEGRKQGGRERNNSSSEVSRPSTTQAFRSDTPFGMQNLRSSTPMVPSIPARQLYVMGGNSGGLNVMGNGLNPSAEPVPNILEDQEGPPMDRHNQWIPSVPSFSFFKPRRTLRN